MHVSRAAAANAKTVDELGAYGETAELQRYESPQTWAVELRFGPYPPSVDDEFENKTPLRDVFGSSPRFLAGVEFDAQLVRIPHVGSFGPAFGWGYTRLTAMAPLSDGTGRSAQTTSLSIMPMYAVGVLRIDVLPRETTVPFVAYVKAGLGYALWWVRDHDEIASENGVSGRGASYGYQYALGGMLHLDYFDERAAAEAYYQVGINNSYLFLEWYTSHLDGFGARNGMQVGSRTWMMGIALEL